MPMNKLAPGTTARYVVTHELPTGDVRTFILDASPEDIDFQANLDALPGATVLHFCLGTGDPTVPTDNPATFVYTPEQAARYNLGYSTTDPEGMQPQGPTDMIMMGWVDRLAERAGVDPSAMQAHFVDRDESADLVASLQSVFGAGNVHVLETAEDFQRLAERAPRGLLCIDAGRCNEY